MLRIRYEKIGTILAVLISIGSLLNAQPVQADSSRTSIEPLLMPPGGAVAPGTGSILVRTKDAVGATVHAFGLIPGHVYTAWLAVFNNPKACATSPCTAADFANLNTEGSVIWGSGQIAGDDGTVNFVVFHAVGDTTGVAPGIGTGTGLLSTKKAQIHLVVRTHGPASVDPAVLQQQLSTFNGGCPPNTCKNVQGAVHEP